MLQEDSQKAAKRVGALFFLATPHHDANTTVKKIILACTPTRQTSGALGPLQATNDEFMDIRKGVQLWSFYETLETELDRESAIIVLEKADAVIGGTSLCMFQWKCVQGAADTSNEHIREMPSNHRDIGKFDKPDDEAYWSIRDAIVGEVRKVLVERTYCCITSIH